MIREVVGVVAALMATLTGSAGEPAAEELVGRLNRAVSDLSKVEAGIGGYLCSTENYSRDDRSDMYSYIRQLTRGDGRVVLRTLSGPSGAHDVVHRGDVMFSVQRAKSSEPWKLLGYSTDVAMEDLYNAVPARDHAVFFPLTYVPGYGRFGDLLENPTFSPQLCRSRQDGCVDLSFAATRKGVDEDGTYEVAVLGEVTLSPTRGYILIASDLRLRWDGQESRVRSEWQYDDGRPSPRCLAIETWVEPPPPPGTRGEVPTIRWRVEFRDFLDEPAPEERFTLDHYDIAPPSDPDAQPGSILSARWLWALASALCFVGAVLLRKVARSCCRV